MKRTTLLTALALALASITASAQQNAAPPPSAPALRSATELEKLVAPIALYSDPLIATILPASVYPLEIVQAERFVANTNNLAKLDAQAWDENVKAVARVPSVIKMMNDDLQWTIALGEAFLAQDKDLLDAVQSLRGRAQQAGTLQTTPQQTVVVVTNRVIEKTERQVLVVTNTIVQIQAVNPEVVYVPTYNPYTAYYPPPGYVYNPYAPLVTFGVGVAVGAAIVNHCDYHSGAVYVGHHGTVVVSSGGAYHGNANVNVDHNTTVNNYNNANVNSGNRGNQATPYNKAGTTGAQQKWQPDQKRLSSTSTLGSKGSASTLEARGWSSSAGSRTSPAAGSVGARPSTGTPATSRPTTSPSASRPAPSQNVSHPSPSPSTSGRGSAFSGFSSGSSTRDFSSRGSSSRSSGGFSGGRSGGGGRGGRR